MLTIDHYTHLDVLDVTGALDKLPSLSTGSGEKGKEEGKVRSA